MSDGPDHHLADDLLEGIPEIAAYVGFEEAKTYVCSSEGCCRASSSARYGTRANPNCAPF